MLRASLHKAVPRIQQLKHTQNIICRNLKTGKGFKNYLAPRDRPLIDRLPLLVRPTIFVLSVGGGSVYLVRCFSNNAHQSSSDQRTGCPLVINGTILANIASFALFEIAKRRDWRAVSRFYQTYMMSNVFGRAPIRSLIGGMFHHIGSLHLVPNMMVLYAVSTAIPTDPLTQLQVYITGGLTATLGSYIQTILRPRFIGTTCGASGAILALLAYAAVRHPDTMVSLPGLDMLMSHGVPVRTVFWTFASIDGLAFITGSRLANHSAHIAGYLYGYLSGVFK